MIKVSNELMDNWNVILDEESIYNAYLSGDRHNSDCFLLSNTYFTGIQLNITNLQLINGVLYADINEVEGLPMNVKRVNVEDGHLIAYYMEGLGKMSRVDLGIVVGPKGDTGNTPDISVGIVTTGNPGTNASVNISGTKEEPVLNFTIPRGNNGEVSEEELDTAVKSMASPVYDNANGDIVTFDDGAKDGLIKSLLATIKPVQSGSGDPYPPGGGKNLLPPNATDETKTINGITVKAQNGVYTVSGTASAYTGISFPLTESVNLNPSANKIAFLNTVESGTTQCAFGRNGTVIHYWALGSVNRIASGWTDSDDEVVNEIIIQVQSGTTVNMTLSPMLIKTDEANPTVFSPYSNICPISGRTGLMVTRAGKNLLDPNDVYKTNANIYFGRKLGIYLFAGITYTASYYGANNCTGIYVTNNSDGSRVHVAYNTKKCTFTVPETGYYKINYYNNDGITYDVTHFQLETGTATTDYTSYAGQTYPISWQTEAGTVYGGTLDVVSGVLTVTDALIASYDGETLPSTWISDRDVYAEGTTPTTGAQVVYKLATPQTYQLTPTEVRTLLGSNAIYTDAGSVSVDYVADTGIYIDNSINKVKRLIAGIETTYVASRNYNVGDFIVVNNDLLKVISAIASGETIVIGTNANITTVAEQLILLFNS